MNYYKESLFYKSTQKLVIQKLKKNIQYFILITTSKITNKKTNEINFQDY